MVKGSVVCVCAQLEEASKPRSEAGAVVGAQEPSDFMAAFGIMGWGAETPTANDWALDDDTDHRKPNLNSACKVSDQSPSPSPDKNASAEHGRSDESLEASPKINAPTVCGVSGKSVPPSPEKNAPAVCGVSGKSRSLRDSTTSLMSSSDDGSDQTDDIDTNGGNGSDGCWQVRET